MSGSLLSSKLLQLTTDNKIFFIMWDEDIEILIKCVAAKIMQVGGKKNKVWLTFKTDKYKEGEFVSWASKAEIIGLQWYV